jgi:hypothetical protein
MGRTKWLDRVERQAFTLSTILDSGHSKICQDRVLKCRIDDYGNA